MTFPEYDAFVARLRVEPPVHRLLAAFIGYKPPAAEEKREVDPNDPSGLGALIKQFPNGFVPAGAL